MGLRFRKSIQILPGVRLNYGLHSTSVSIGVKGFRTTYSSTGRVTRSIGIPGTGISYVTSNTTRNRNASRIENLPEYHSSTPPQNSLPSQRSTTIASANHALDTEAIDTIRESIHAIYRFSDNPINWKKILVSENNPGIEHWDYFKSRAESVLNGDIDTYFEIISDINPLDDLIQYGSNFECGTDDPRMLVVDYQVNSQAVLSDGLHIPTQIQQDLLQDYICGCTIRIARDMFALLPLRHLIVNAKEQGSYVLSVDFEKQQFDRLDFSSLDASDTVELFRHRMAYDKSTGFSPITPLI